MYSKKCTCPLCGDEMSPLTVSTHKVPREKWYTRQAVRKTFELVSCVDGTTTLTHQFCLEGQPVSLVACGRCGYVKAAKLTE